ncbi:MULTISPECIES: DUF4320 family protein [Eubacteriales]|uniref:DUF4320 family protein n=2 Tax=Caproicibacterium TaxID=2834348 RepID=A0A859DVK0_9FIRM|nr:MULTISPECIES: DUF4320 family protein [Caproicibacterium]QKN24051.1 DUF4320 family protein [Caproicibacterium lactatifermentans]WOC31105.1 DUF4320 family protein [Caproicibacterium argilliputei]HBN80454.1 hypothetical protein [Oscillospiraceae bacterium]
MLKRLRSRRGEGYIDIAVLVLCAMLVIAFAVKLFPVYIEKNQLDSFATELCREAEISGRVGTETDARARELEEQTGLHPSVDWSRTGKIPLDQEFTVTVSAQANIGLFGGFGSFPINLEGKANGKSEIYWK